MISFTWSTNGETERIISFTWSTNERNGTDISPERIMIQNDSNISTTMMIYTEWNIHSIRININSTLVFVPCQLNEQMMRTNERTLLVTSYLDPNWLLRVQFKGRYSERNGYSSIGDKTWYRTIHTVLVTIIIISGGNVMERISKMNSVQMIQQWRDQRLIIDTESNAFSIRTITSLICNDNDSGVIKGRYNKTIMILLSRKLDE